MNQASGERSQDQWSSGLVKLGYAGVYLFFLFLLQNTDCGYSLEPPIYVLSKNKKNIRKILMRFFIFLQPKKILYIAWACFHNDMKKKAPVVKGVIPLS